jgi:hypothetical protein
MLEYLTQEQFNQKAEFINANFKTKNYRNYKDRWLYHRQAIDWIKELKPKTILEIGGLGMRLTNISDVMDYDKSGWAVDNAWTYNQDIDGELDLPQYDLIVALRVYHHSKDFEKSFNNIKKYCKHLILALPKEMLVTGYTSVIKCKDSNIYLWKSE